MTAEAVPASAEAGVRARPELDAVTLLCYGAFGALGFLLNGLGPVLPPLQRELDVSRAQVAWYPTLFAAGLIAVGLVGHRAIERLGRQAAFRLAVAGLVAGAGVLAAAVSPELSAIGAGVMGGGGALLVVLVPAILADRHGGLSTGAISQANAVASATSVLAPLLVAAAVTAGAGWRAGFLLLPIAALVPLALVDRRARFPRGTGAHLSANAGKPIEAEGTFVRRWLDIVLVVSAEFCVIFWSTDYLESELDAGDAAAPALASLFLVGMALGRAAGGHAARRLARSRAIFISALALAACGFALFWSTTIAVVAAAGLLVTGLGVALLYPLSISRALAAARSPADRASGYAALASGLAIGVAPFALAALAEDVGLRAAFLVVPALLALAAVNALAPARRAGRAAAR
jgi:MFS family permease